MVEGRAESDQTLELFEKALAGDPPPRQVDVAHPREGIIFPDKRTTFGVVEMPPAAGGQHVRRAPGQADNGTHSK